MKIPLNVHPLQIGSYLQSRFTVARNRHTETADFVHASDQIIRYLIYAGLELFEYQDCEVNTPTNNKYRGCQLVKEVQAVSVIRAGESMEQSIRQVLPGVKIGKILIQRNPETLEPKLFYSHLAGAIEKSNVLVFEPMLATGGSLEQALELILARGVRAENIVCLNLLASPEGLERIATKFEGIRFVVGSIEQGLTENGFMIPGIGDFGDRYFGTR